MKINKRIIIGVFLLLILANLIIIQSKTNLTNINDGFFIFFFLHNVNLNITFTMCFIFLLGYCVVDDYYVFSHDKFDRLVIQRLGYKRYYRNSLLQIIKRSIIFKLSFDILFLINIYILGYSFDLVQNYLMIPQVLAFQSNIVNNLIAYLIISTIGVAFFSIFLFFLIDFIRNKYIYRVFTIILIMIMSVVSTVVSFPIYRVIMPILHNNDRLSRTLLSFYNPMGMIEPGMQWSSYGYVNFVITAIFFLVISFILYRKAMKARLLYD